MKALGFLAFLPLIAAMPVASAKSELEILRTRCVEQERQIRQLEEENHRLKSDKTPATTASFWSGGMHLISTAPENPPSSKTSGAPAAEPKKPNSGDTYVVRKGDSLERIADKLNTSTKALAKLNGITTETMLHPGRTLKVPGSAGSTTPKPKPTSSDTYAVRQGDTYFSIARKLHTSPEALQKINPSVKATALHPGVVLRLKSTSEKPKAHSEEPQKTEATSKAEPKPAAKAETKPAAKPEPVAKTDPKSAAKPAAKPEPKTPGKSEASKKDAKEFQPVAKHGSEAPPAAPKENPPSSSKPATPSANTTPATGANASQQATVAPKKTGIHPIPVTEKISFGEFATKHGTTITKLNEMNGLSLNGSTILAEGSELYIPAQP
jgi:LysM repeat protein